ncbi:MAG: hypothetical protein JW993_01600 [Sedimentisphaerales bacterium]|nr:hypothetical protein [Sedimentisphaerales bacterium]
MPKPIIITLGKTTIRADLNGSTTAKAIAAELPIEASANRWGEEIYFSIDVQAEVEADASDIVETGDLAYWPPGNAFCIFFGRTPASQGKEIHAASPVNVVGRVQGDLAPLHDVPDGAPVVIKAS